MSDIDFYVTTTLRNEVQGITLGTSPEAWKETLGGDFIDDAKKSRMRRDYGLIEVAFAKRDGAWTSVSVSLQIHRLGPRP